MSAPGSTNPPVTVVGVISDTHGLLRPEAMEALRGSHLILHAGDVGSPGIMDVLAGIAPVIAVRGNVDTELWAESLPTDAVAEVGERSVYLLHDIGKLDLKPEAAGLAAVIYGHSHKPKHEIREGVLFFNPGSAGPRRFKLPVSVGRLRITGSIIEPEIIILAV